MNKLLIVFLAVCLVSAHAFVKRDTTLAEDAKSKVDAAGAKLAEAGTSIKDGVAKGYDEVSKSVSGFVKRDTTLAEDAQSKVDAAGAKLAEIGTGIKDGAVKAHDDLSKSVSSYKAEAEGQAGSPQ